MRYSPLISIEEIDNLADLAPHIDNIELNFDSLILKYLLTKQAIFQDMRDHIKLRWIFIKLLITKNIIPQLTRAETFAEARSI